MKLNSFFIFISGFVAGVAVRSFFRADDLSPLGGYFSFAIFLFFLSLALFSIQFLLRQKNIFVVVLFIFASALGVARFDISDMDRGDILLDSSVNRAVKIEGVITDEPDVRENNVNLVVDIEKLFTKSITDTGEVIDVKSRARVTVSPYTRFEYGDRVFLEGELQKPKNFTNEESGREFDFVSYLGKDGIFYQMFYPETMLVSHDNRNFLRAKLFDFKHAFLDNISDVIPQPHSSLLGGLVVGAKESLGRQLLDDFRLVGLIHIVVLSGYNVTIIAEALMRALSFLPRALSLWFGAGSIVLFATMVGGGATIVRASIMAIIVILARGAGRDYGISRALFAAGFLMLLHNPKILVFDISFQLSFLATLGLIYLAPALEKYFHFLPTKFQLREFALATVATQIFVLPLLLYKMGELSFFALPVNLLVLVFIPITMLFGFLTGIVGFFATILSMPFAFITYLLLAYQLKIVEIFSSIPFASVHIKSFPFWLTLLVYIFYSYILYRLLSVKMSDSVSEA